MGTNFYRILTEKEFKNQNEEKYYKLYSLIKSYSSNVTDLVSIMDYIRESIMDMETRVHIGKRSAGWKFLFDRYLLDYIEEPYTKEAIIEFLKKGKIVDEYDKEYTFDEFWDSISIDSGYDLESYYEDYPCKYRNNHDLYKDEYIDGLRFTKIKHDFS